MIGALEAALSGEPILSPPLDVNLANGKQVKVVFQELSPTVKDRLRMDALGWVEERRRAVESTTGFEIRDAQSEFDAMRINRWDLLMLHAALRDAEHPEVEACSLMVLEHHLDPQARTHLSAKYYEFEEGLDPNKVTAESVQEFVEELKKKRLSPIECWRRYGSAVLWSSLIFLADLLPTSPEEQSSDGSLSETSA